MSEEPGRYDAGGPGHGCARSRELIRMLRLQPHPEGGHYREVFRAAEQVQPQDGRPARSGLTSIYFLLARGEFSRWHRVASSEAWHHHEGGELELLVAPPSFERVASVRLGRVSEGVRPSYALPPGWWQAARPLGDYALCGCDVGPGFDFADFSFLRDEPRLAARLASLDPAAASLL
jgi:predicted cupin superfamily sugar epimerase